MTESHVRPGRRERRKQQTRTALLDAAMSQFRERGIYGTRIADITKHADVGKGVFYNYFPTKEAIVAELIRRGLELLEREFLMTLSGDAGLQDRIRQLSNMHDEFFESNPEYALLIHQGRGLLLRNDQKHQVIHEVFRDYLMRLSRWLPPSSMSTSWDTASLLDMAAAIAGAVAGYRSFRIAAGLAIGPGTIGDMLAMGVTCVMDRRKHG